MVATPAEISAVIRAEAAGLEFNALTSCRAVVPPFVFKTTLMVFPTTETVGGAPAARALRVTATWMELPPTPACRAARRIETVRLVPKSDVTEAVL